MPPAVLFVGRMCQIISNIMEAHEPVLGVCKSHIGSGMVVFTLPIACSLTENDF